MSAIEDNFCLDFRFTFPSEPFAFSHPAMGPTANRAWNGLNRCWAILLYYGTCSLAVNRGQGEISHSNLLLSFLSVWEEQQIVSNTFPRKLICPLYCNFICKDLSRSDVVLTFIVHNPFLRLSGATIVIKKLSASGN
jgi:hypothetical protein